MKTLQSITTILLTLALLVAGIAGFALQADACECDFAMYTDERPFGTDGDIILHDTWNVRAINTTVIEQGSSISRSGNEITLQPGTYYIHVVAEIFRTYGHKLRLRTTANETLAVGHTCSTEQNLAQLQTYVVVTSETTFRIEHYTWKSPNHSIGGIHIEGNHGEPEVYLTARIVKVTSDACH